MDKSKEIFNEALALFSKNEFEKSFNVFKKIPPNTMDTLKFYHMGMCLVKMGKLERALNFYQKVREVPTENPDVNYDKLLYGMYVNMGSVMQVMGSRKMRKEKLHNLKNPKTPFSKQKNETSWKKLLQDSLSCYEYALQINDGDAQVWNNMGNAYVDLEQYHEAHKHLDQALELENDYPEAHYSKSLAYEFMHFYPKAIKHLEIALKTRKSNKTYLLHIISLLFGTKKFEEAEEYALKMVKYHTKDPQAYKFLSLILYNLKRYDDAYEVYLDLLKLNPEFDHPDTADIFEDLKEKAKKK